MNKNRGFTLIELMIVIAILAILMAYAIPAYRNYTVRAKAGEALMLAAPLKRFISEVWVNTSVVNNLNSGVGGVPTATSMTGEYVSQISVVGGVITAIYQNDVTLTGNTLTLTPHIPGSGSNNGNSLLWVCTSTLNNQFLPPDCRTN